MAAQDHYLDAQDKIAKMEQQVNSIRALRPDGLILTLILIAGEEHGGAGGPDGTSSRQPQNQPLD